MPFVATTAGNPDSYFPHEWSDKSARLAATSLADLKVVGSFELSPNGFCLESRNSVASGTEGEFEFRWPDGFSMRVAAVAVHCGHSRRSAPGAGSYLSAWRLASPMLPARLKCSPLPA